MAIQSDPFLSAKLRVGRAKELFDTLVKETRAFADSDPQVFFKELDPDGLYEIYKCRLARHTPPHFDFLVVEIVEHLRASLDHLAYAAAILGGKGDAKQCYFPIADTASQLETDVIGRRKCQDLPSDILTFFRGLQPYKGGNANAVWVINKLCNIGKHRFLTSVGLQSAYANITIDKLPPESKVFPHAWDSKKNEISYFAVPKGMQPQHDFEVAFFIAFGPFEPLAGAPILPHLADITKDITRIIETTEIEVRRIGLIT